MALRTRIVTARQAKRPFNGSPGPQTPLNTQRAQEFPALTLLSKAQCNRFAVEKPILTLNF